MPSLLVIGLLVAVPTIVLGGVMIAHWARVQSEREASQRRRNEVVHDLLAAVERALDPAPQVSLDGLRTLGSLRDHEALEPEDDDYIEEIANVVVTTRVGTPPGDAPLELGRSDDASDSEDSQVVRPPELVAARLALDVAAARGRPPNPLSQRVANASSDTAGAPATEPLRRTA
jgi:hypothetical protein